MTKRMLIDATHAEETRVVVLDGNRLEEFDVETSTKKQLKGNIYLAKIVRVEPSLQAAFVEYGGNRHGFLAFGEIHPDYYQIPVADRQRLLRQQEQEAREAEEAEDAAAAAEEAEGGTEAPEGSSGAENEEKASAPDVTDQIEAGELSDTFHSTADGDLEPVFQAAEPEAAIFEPAFEPEEASDPAPAMALPMDAERVVAPDAFVPEPFSVTEDAELADALTDAGLAVAADGEIISVDEGSLRVGGAAGSEESAEAAPVAPALEVIGGDSDGVEERERRTPTSRFLRNYKIQEVIHRRQILLVQVVKEERGGKGAALTTYISLAGRFCVLMPNSPRGGGISRKITSTADRRRLKEITAELDIPSGMGLIVRTAGAARPKPEIRRDCEYLLNLWDDIRETTLKSVAPAAIYEEASLIKRAIRDIYARDVDEVLVDGQAAWHSARDQMRLLMPSHAHKVQLWQQNHPLFAEVEPQLDAMLSPNVQLRSGGYLVINQTEALVAIDVNSGRSTRERGIEETAVRTNLEAAEEVARQLRLRDLAGLIVIDFIDMESRRNNTAVERKLKDALKTDRARIQLGTISHFGLMEMSRQRLRPSLAETSFVQCPQCGGTGHVRSVEGSSIHVLRAIDEEGGRRRSAEIMVHVAGPVAMYILNHKRERLREIEARYGMAVLFNPDPTLLPPALKIDKLRSYAAGEAPAAPANVVPVEMAPSPPTDLEEPDFEAVEPETAALSAPSAEPRPAAASGEGESGARRRRRRRRRGGRRDDERSAAATPGAEQPEVFGEEGEDGEEAVPTGDAAGLEMDGAIQVDASIAGGDAQTAEEAPVVETSDGAVPSAEPAPAGQGVGLAESSSAAPRGGRRRRRGAPAPAAESAPYTGPTPANPFGGGTFDIFDALEQLEASVPAPSPAAPPAATVAPVLPPPAAEPSEPPPDAVTVASSPEVSPDLPADPPVKPAPRRRRTRAAAPAPQPEFAAAPAEPDLPAPVLPEPVPPEPVLPEPTPPEPLAEPAPIALEEPAVADNLVKPVLVEAAPEAPRRGWWRR